MDDAKRIRLDSDAILDALDTFDSDASTEEVHLDDEEELDPTVNAADPVEGLEVDDEDNTRLGNLSRTFRRCVSWLYQSSVKYREKNEFFVLIL